MKGRKVAWTHEKALAFMMCNEVRGRSLSRIKRMARREDRRYKKKILKYEVMVLD